MAEACIVYVSMQVLCLPLWGLWLSLCHLPSFSSSPLDQAPASPWLGLRRLHAPQTASRASDGFTRLRRSIHTQTFVSHWRNTEYREKLYFVSTGIVDKAILIKLPITTEMKPPISYREIHHDDRYRLFLVAVILDIMPWLWGQSFVSNNCCWN